MSLYHNLKDKKGNWRSYELLVMNDKRELDEWLLPIGPSYEEKKWSELNKEEMMADFDWKSDILDGYGEEVSSATFYQDYLFRELYSGEIEGYKVLVTEYDADKGNKVHKVDVDDLHEFLNLNDVALSPCLFFKNWRRKSLLNYVSAFVLDIDKLRPSNLSLFFERFELNRLLTPTFIANSGSGVHFYYVLDQMLKIDTLYNEANRLIAEEIYKCLYDDVIKKEHWRDAQRHWIGQDYRVVNSKTKLNQTAQIFKVGDVYSIDDLIEHYGIKIDREKRYASPKMINYANSIAKDLNLEKPDFSNAKETYEFINTNKDAAYQVREERRKQRAMKVSAKSGKKRPGTWYRNTLDYMKDHTTPGHRFSAMKALAMIGYKEREKVSRETFMEDLDMLVAYWSSLKWNGDYFNEKNVEAIIRFYDNAHKYDATAETLEEWLGYEFKRIPQKRNGRSQVQHLQLARGIRTLKGQMGESVSGGGRPTAEQKVSEWQQLHPDGKKADCIRDTGLSKKTVYKWWK